MKTTMCESEDETTKTSPSEPTEEEPQPLVCNRRHILPPIDVVLPPRKSDKVYMSSEAQRLASAKWKIRNKEKVKAYAKEYYTKNKKIISDTRKQQRKELKEIKELKERVELLEAERKKANDSEDDIPDRLASIVKLSDTEVGSPEVQ
jgi:septal ring factor EnvC (AmiA/AmiB activator)